jgi:N-ethylmaleimide reductase
MTDSKLFSTYRLGNLELQNRVVMAPMTRNRAIDNAPGELEAKYYGLRSATGLIVTEGVGPSANGTGYARQPGLFSAAQIEGWKKVTAAAHAGGAKIFAQLMHTGRASHPDNLPAGGRVVAPSAIAIPSETWVDGKGQVATPPPAAMTEEDIDATLNEFAQAAENAVAADFDGIELHGANGYLIDQFLNPASNQRSDRWGTQTIENRIRFATEAARRAAAKIGKERVGIRVSPYGAFNGMAADDAVEDAHQALAAELSKLGIVYMHIVDHSPMGAPEVKPSIKRKLRETFKGTLILSGGYDAKRAEADLVEGRADLIAFGRPFLANPNLVDKLKRGAELRAPDFATFYTPGEKGYTDWPVD